MIEYKAVAMDLDDTLLTSDLQISEETKQTLLQCQKDSPFVPVMKPGTEAFLSKCALGNLEVLPIGGNHLSCLMTPNVEGMANLLDGKGERV